MKKELTMLAVSDTILQLPNPEFFFEHTVKTLNEADIVSGQLEVVYTDRGMVSSTDVAATPCEFKNIKALKYAGFDVMTLAGNHLFDSGQPGVEDTIKGLDELGIAYTGAGMNLDDARKPAILEREGTKIGFLSYNCVGPRLSWATIKKSGCAYVDILTHYELDYATPGGPPAIYTFAEPRSLKRMVEDIQSLRNSCDVLVVALHKGIGHVPIKLAQYEFDVSRIAIDAGADLILGHHAHILKGVEVYKGKVIFHGMCNFVCGTNDLSVKKGEGDQQWAIRRKELFGFVPDPEYPTYPFHPEARNTLIVKCIIADGKLARVGYIPCIVNKQAQPLIVTRSEQGQQVYDYIQKITEAAGIHTSFTWSGDEVIINI